MNESKRKVQWSVDASHAEFIEQLEGNFREVVDPEIGLNILELGLVRDVIIEQTGAHIIMMMTTPFCPYAPALLEMARRKAEEALNMPTSIEMSLDPWDPSMMEEGTGGDWGLF